MIYKSERITESFARKFANDIDWNKLACNKRISANFLFEFKDKITNWRMISEHRDIDMDFVLKFKDNILFKYVKSLWKEKLSVEFLRTIKDVIDWKRLTNWDHWEDIEFIREFKDKLNWREGCNYDKLLNNDDFIIEFIKYIPLRKIPEKFWMRKMDDEFKSLTLENPSKVKWDIIFTNCQLDDDYINKICDKFLKNPIKDDDSDDEYTLYGVEYLCKYQNFSDEIMNKLFKEKKFIRNICKYQKLTEEFMEKQLEHLNWENVSKYQPLREEFITKYSKKVNWKMILKYQQLSKKFIEDNKNKIKEQDSPTLISEKNNWLTLSEDIKKEKIAKFYENIEIDGQHWIKCYKAVRYNYTSIFGCNLYTYNDLGKVYTTKCNYDSSVVNSYGFGCWTKDQAIKYGISKEKSHKLIEVIVPLNKMCMLENGKIRAEQMIITGL